MKAELGRERGVGSARSPLLRMSAGSVPAQNERGPTPHAAARLALAHLSLYAAIIQRTATYTEQRGTWLHFVWLPGVKW